METLPPYEGTEGRCPISAFDPKPRRQWRVAPRDATFGYLLVVNRSPRTQSYSWNRLGRSDSNESDASCGIPVLDRPTFSTVS
jgi:hypothetical protein